MVTHAIGIALSVAGLVLIVTLCSLRGDAWQVTSTAVFGTTLVLLYTTSTLYHGFRDAGAKRLMRKFDHAAIFLLIAGTYTPFSLVTLRGPWGWSLFGVVWGLAAIGVVLKFWFAGRFLVASTLIYVAMGWIVLVAIKPLLAVMDDWAFGLLVGGGVSYTGGAAFYLCKRVPYHHAVWHLFVLGGSVCHYFAVLHALAATWA